MHHRCLLVKLHSLVLITCGIRSDSDLCLWLQVWQLLFLRLFFEFF